MWQESEHLTPGLPHPAAPRWRAWWQAVPLDPDSRSSLACEVGEGRGALSGCLLLPSGPVPPQLPQEAVWGTVGPPSLLGVEAWKQCGPPVAPPAMRPSARQP